MRNIYLKHKCVANGVNPFQSAFVPSFACICLKQSAMPLYCPVLSSCKRVFTTSTGWRQHACFIVLKKRVSEKERRKTLARGRTEPTPPSVWREKTEKHRGRERARARLFSSSSSSSPPLFQKPKTTKRENTILTHLDDAPERTRDGFYRRTDASFPSRGGCGGRRRGRSSGGAIFFRRRDKQRRVVMMMKKLPRGDGGRGPPATTTTTKPALSRVVRRRRERRPARRRRRRRHQQVPQVLGRWHFL